RDRPQIPGTLVGDVFFSGFRRRYSRTRLRVVLAQGDRTRRSHVELLADARQALIHSTPTAREIRRTMIVSEIKICVIVKSFAQRVRTGASVGPNVELVVKAMKR